MRWLWWRREPAFDTDDSHKAVEDSRRSLEASKERWPRVNEVTRRAERAHEQVRSQRDQNHLGDIVRIALQGGRTT